MSYIGTYVRCCVRTEKFTIALFMQYFSFSFPFFLSLLSLDLIKCVQKVESLTINQSHTHAICTAVSLSAGCWVLRKFPRSTRGLWERTNTGVRACVRTYVRYSSHAVPTTQVRSGSPRGSGEGAVGKELQPAQCRRAQPSRTNEEEEGWACV